MSILRYVFNITDKEGKPVAFSFCYYFCLMSGYFILRPVRDEMGIQAGVENMQWLFTGTFLTMLILVPVFGFLVKKIQIKRLVPGIYLFFSFNILLFYFGFTLLDEPAVLSVIFFIWLSVFNLFVISVFWSFNADIFSLEQAARFFGPIAAGGSLGAIAGPAVTTFLAGELGISNLLLVSSGLMLAATYFIHLLIKYHGKEESENSTNPIGGKVMDGFRLIVKSKLLLQVGVFILLYTSISTFLYFQQAHIISGAYDSSIERTTYFGTRDLIVNVLTLVMQFFVTEKIMRNWGLKFCLVIVPIIAVIGFLLLGYSPSVLILLIIQVAYRSFSHALQRPARELIFTTVSKEERYKSKNFIDTAVYRGGDAISGWLFAMVAAVVSSLQIVALLAVPIGIGWLLVANGIGKHFNLKKAKTYEFNDQHLIKKKSA